MLEAEPAPRRHGVERVPAVSVRVAELPQDERPVAAASAAIAVVGSVGTGSAVPVGAGELVLAEEELRTRTNFTSGKKIGTKDKG